MQQQRHQHSPAIAAAAAAAAANNSALTMPFSADFPIIELLLLNPVHEWRPKRIPHKPNDSAKGGNDVEAVGLHGACCPLARQGINEIERDRWGPFAAKVPQGVEKRHVCSSICWIADTRKKGHLGCED
mmetsp:Transcript_85530/g.169735  ORF Transcript_85530/g.169735 Transcript_85530/m.169735 type:complete len:129 (-) Transcript_85530:1217-1603(-)